MFASILSGMAGGGGGLITAPFFILLGIPAQAAVATAKFGGVGITLGSVARFRKTEHVKWGYVVYLSALSIAGAILGTRLLLLSSNEIVERLVGVMVLAAVPFMFRKDLGVKSAQPTRLKEILGYVLYFITAVLQAAFGSGIGMTLTFILMGLFGFTALEAVATRRIPGFILALASLIAYIASGIVYYGHGLAMLFGMMIGGYIGSHIAVTRGNRFVKWVFAIMVAILGIQLLI